MDHYKKYREEKDGATVLTNEHGFCVYSIVGDRCHVGEIYVRKEKRNQGIADYFQREIIIAAKKGGATYLSCFVQKGLQGTIKNTKRLLKAGFEIVGEDDEKFVLKKEI